MEKEFKCIKEFAVSKYDKHECPIKNEEVIVPVGSFWTLYDFASLSDVRLEGGRFGWIEIDEHTLKTHFEEL